MVGRTPLRWYMRAAILNREFELEVLGTIVAGFGWLCMELIFNVCHRFLPVFSPLLSVAPLGGNTHL